MYVQKVTLERDSGWVKIFWKKYLILDEHFLKSNV